MRRAAVNRKLLRKLKNINFSTIHKLY